MMKRGDKQRGYTLIEMTIAAAILGLLITMVYELLSTAQKSFDAGSNRSNVQIKARRILDDMAQDLRQSGAAACILLSSSSVQFSKNTGYTSPSIVWGDQTTYSLQYDSEESNNGIDDNGNGYIDECTITKTVSGQSVIVARNIKENGLVFAIEPTNKVRINLTVLGKNEKGEVIEVAEDTKVQFRN